MTTSSDAPPLTRCTLPSSPTPSKGPAATCSGVARWRCPPTVSRGRTGYLSPKRRPGSATRTKGWSCTGRPLVPRIVYAEHIPLWAPSPSHAERAPPGWMALRGTTAAAGAWQVGSAVDTVLWKMLHRVRPGPGTESGRSTPRQWRA